MTAPEIPPEVVERINAKRRRRKPRYRYFNLNTGCFVESQGELLKQLGNRGDIRAIPQPKPPKGNGEILVVGSWRRIDEQLACAAATQMASRGQLK